MGGPVKIAVRLPDGKQMANELYTSSISAFFNNDRFYEYDLFHIRRFMIDLADDDRMFSPTGYGLVVGDFVNKKIYTLQDYTSLGKIRSVSLALSMDATYTNSDTKDDDYLESNRFVRLYDKGYIPNKTVSTWSGNSLHMKDIPLAPLTSTDVLRLVADELIESQMTIFQEFYIRSDWEIIEYNEDSNGYIQFKADLDKAGFVFSVKETNIWVAKISEHLLWEEEDK